MTSSTSRVLKLLFSVFVSSSAFGQVTAYAPYSLSTLGAISSAIATGGDTPTISYTLVAGTESDEPQVIFNYSGGGSAANTYTAFGPQPVQIPVTSSSVVGSYQLQSVTLLDAGGQTVYNRDGSISRLFYTPATNAPTTHTFNFAADDFSIEAVALPPPSGPLTARLINLSTRAYVGTGANILIAGFYISGAGTETLLIRADGPSLNQFGLQGIAQPALVVFDGKGNEIASNTGWGTSGDPSEISIVSAGVGAFPFQAGSADSAIVITLPPGAYTAQISGVGGTTGTGLAEVYEVSYTNTRLSNISTRTSVNSGVGPLISGFVIRGTGTEQLLVRGDGPGLAQFGVPDVLEHPSLSFSGGSASIPDNIGWGTFSNQEVLKEDENAVGAFAFAPGSADCAEVLNAQPGAYTAIVSGVGGSSGDALVEVYEVP